MKSFSASVAAMIVVALVSAAAPRPAAAAPQAPQSPSAPTLMRFDGALKTPTGEPRTGIVLLVASVYAAQGDSTPLWFEQQSVTLDAAGQYTLVVGATLDDGIPKELFLTGSGRWLGIGVQGEAEQPRIMLVTVPYALKAREADTLAGRFFSDFVLSDQLKDSVKAVLNADEADGSTPGILGTTNRVVKFDGSGNATADSTIFDNGNIGIGTTTPYSGTNVTGLTINATSYPSLALYSGNAPTALFWTNQATDVRLDSVGPLPILFEPNGAEAMRLTSVGKVGIGTTSPRALFHLSANPASMLMSSISNTAGPYQYFETPNGYYNFRTGAGDNAWTVASGGAGSDAANDSYSSILSVSAYPPQVIVASGYNVGIGTTAPVEKLDVVGNINVSGNINAKYQDVAEWVETSGRLDPGTVVIVDPLESNRVLPATRAYDTRVAGAVSRQPGLLLGERSDTKAMVAQSGRVRVKVDAKYGAIRTGDLLVTSPTPGHAMRSRPMRLAGGQSLHRPGTLVGKALQPLAKGQGEILVLLTLQ